MSSDPAALERRIRKLEAILDVAKAMAAQRELDGLLELVADHAARVTDAERASIFLLDKKKGELWSKVAHGSDEIRFPADQGIAGHVVACKEPLSIPDAYQDPRFNQTFDKESGFRTKELLAVPMLSTQDDVVGVIETLNHKSGGGPSAPFGKDDEELLLALGGQAASAIENALLYQEIGALFEGFIKASVVAIESRDPTTSGHSERVAILTCGLARVVDRADTGPFSAVHFSTDQMKELRYASLLHDFGKVGVREHVLIKAEKLYPFEKAALETRFQFIRRTIEKQALERKLECAGPGQKERWAEIDADVGQRLAELDEIYRFLLACNVPTVLAQGGFDRLKEIAKRTYESPEGPKPYLTDQELISLSVPKGSLTEQDRLEIESHVTHTYRFLSAIPWTRSLKGVPEIAYGHHEKLDGAGYPRALASSSIAIQTRMMTISDIFDALTASDRPYKKAVPVPKALDILKLEAKDRKVDPELLGLFIEAKVYEKSLGSR